MKKTKIDWCDSTINCVYGCPNNCKYCYGNVMNNRFHFCKKWSIPEYKPEHLKDFYSKKPRSIFIDSMSDIGTWKQEWFNEVMKAIADNPQHRYIALTKRLDDFYRRLCNYRMSQGLVTLSPNEIGLHLGVSITTQKQADKFCDEHCVLDFLSVEPILEEIDFEKICRGRMAQTLIIGAETGNRKDKVIPKKEWVDKIVKQADEYGIAVFMKSSLKKIMGDDFRQDKLPWSVK